LSKASIGEELLGALLVQKELQQIIDLGNFRDMLTAHEKEAWDFISGFVGKHKAFPTHETVELEKQVILPSPKEVPSYYHEHLRKQWVTGKLVKATQDGKAHLKIGKVDPDAAYAAMMTTLLEIHQRNNAGKMYDARYLLGPVMDLHKKGMGFKPGIEFGWPYLDDNCGGLYGGDLISYVGRPAHGKTWQLLWSARHAWLTQKKRILFISMEMDPVQILTRLAALESGVENKTIKAGKMAAFQKKKVKNLKYLEKNDTPFWVIDGALSATVQDILLLARTLNPDAIYIDGAYLVRHPNVALGPYQRVAIVCEQMKMDLATGLSLPVIASWQFSRDAPKKKKDGSKVGLEDIAYSDVIGQLSAIVLGLFEGETIESVKRKRVDMLKGRGGEEGEFYTHWDFKKMNFAQWDYKGAVNKEMVHTKDETDYGG
jgi:replicative DNA helicase